MLDVEWIEFREAKLHLLKSNKFLLFHTFLN